MIPGHISFRDSSAAASAAKVVGTENSVISPAMGAANYTEKYRDTNKFFLKFTGYPCREYRQNYSIIPR